jgi:putative acetyltransferase
LALRFRALEEKDFPALLDLWAASWTEVYEDFEADRAWFEGHVRAEMANGALCRLGEDDGLAGFLLIHPAAGFIEHICVAADRKGQGIGLALLEEASRLSPRGLELTVRAANGRAIRFYEREGFLRIGESASAFSGLPIWRYRREPRAVSVG